MKNDLGNFSDSQESREQDYLTSGVFRTKDDGGNLHMFFSPRVVPAGLTDDEVRKCLELYPRKAHIEECLMEKYKLDMETKYQKAFEENYLLFEEIREGFARIWGEYAFSLTAENISKLMSLSHSIMYHPLSLPLELGQSPMTRECFARGVALLVARMDELEKNL